MYIYNSITNVIIYFCIFAFVITTCYNDYGQPHQFIIKGKEYYGATVC